MDSIQNARKILNNLADGIVDRCQIEAYARISAFCDHFPNFASRDDFELLQRSSRIEKLEYDRFLKQRRIALSDLAEKFRDSL